MPFFQYAKTVIKNLAGKPATLMYPVKPAKKFNATRGRIENDINRCIFCGMCSRKCPCVAICVDRTAKTWEIDRYRCVICNCCVEVCPVKCLRTETSYSPLSTEKQSKTLMRPDKPASPAPPQEKPKE
jgi:ech hydrogenase subunit F